MKRSFERFLKNRSGAFAMQFALMVVPLMACTGLAIDGGRAFLARFELGSALDAAALAVGSTTSKDDATLNDVARRYIDKNFHQAPPGSVALTLVSGTDVVSLKGTVRIDTFFMPIMGIDHVNVSAESEVRRGGANVEVSLLLDTTGSMGSGTKISDLRTAAGNLIDIVVNDQQTPFYSKVAVIPWSMGVNAGAYADSVRGPATGATAITAADWRNGSAKSISFVDWKNGASKSISGAAWKNGSSKTPSAISKSSNQVTITSNGHGFANGNYLRITGVGGMTQLNNNIYLVSDVTTNTFKLKDASTSAYINSSSFSSFTSGGTLQRCFDAACDVQITTSSSHGFSTGDLVHISGISGFTYANNSGSGTWTITNSTSTTFLLDGSNGFTSQTYSSGGTAQRCFDATCEVQVQSTAHGFSNGDYVYITGVNGFTYANNTVGTTWTVSGATSNAFFLSGTTNMSSGIYSSAGTVSKCFTSACEVRVTSASHGLANGDYVYITGVNGMTQINTSGNNSWPVSNAASNTFVLGGTLGPNYSNYSSGGSSWCLKQGCEYYRFTNASGSTRIFEISTCTSERTGSNAYTDVSPSDALVGRNYASSGNPCLTNQIVPLTSSKSDLHTAINALVAQGSTAGQVGVAWGWYMISPNFASLWPSGSQPAAYGAPYLAKVMVLMTDGSFNSPYCNGVIAKDAASGSGSTSDHINCNATNGDSYTQAKALCAAMKQANITIFTVGFDVGTDPNAIDLMNTCATNASHAYIAATGADLNAAFQSIAKEIARLRLSK
ncbi:MAG: hypothetical protein GC155_10870 [Alphaproteobacteria bacterium]|nr:hypothetical protein [Alphaproteobacteria bacterium]